MEKFFPKTPAEIMLLSANLIPMAGVLFWGWEVVDIMILFWAENVIIGIMNIIKMTSVMVVQKNPGALFMIPFFTVHYGMFTAVHGIFVFTMFGQNDHLGMDDLTTPETVFTLIQGLEWAILCLFLSHTFSFLANFIVGREVDRTTLGQLMGAPYGRVVALHITIIFGGMLALATGNATWALLLLTLFKTAGDLLAHRISHEKLART